MSTIFINLIFTIFTIVMLVKTIGYAIYEIKKQDNLYGGIVTIIFCIASIIFSNIIIWMK